MLGLAVLFDRRNDALANSPFIGVYVVLSCALAYYLFNCIIYRSQSATLRVTFVSPRGPTGILLVASLSLML